MTNGPSFSRREVVSQPRVPPRDMPTTRINHGIDSIVTPPAGGGGSISFPFQLLDVSVGGGTPEARIYVRYGTLQDVAPTNVGTDIAISTGTTVFYLDLEIDINGVLVAVTLSNGASKPADTDYHGYITLGEADSPDGEIVTAIRQAATHSLRYSMCGRVVEDDVLVAPGTYEFWGF